MKLNEVGSFAIKSAANKKKAVGLGTYFITVLANKPGVKLRWKSTYALRAYAYA